MRPLTALALGLAGCATVAAPPQACDPSAPRLTCPAPASDCLLATCDDGVCAVHALADGQACDAGVCRAGRCVAH